MQNPCAGQEPAPERLCWAGGTSSGCRELSVGSAGVAGASRVGFCALVKCRGGQSIQAAPAHGGSKEQEAQQQWDRIQKVSELWTVEELVYSLNQTSSSVCIPDFYLCISISQLLNAFRLDDIWYCCLLTLGTVALTLLLPSDIYTDTDIVLISIMAAKFMTQH